MQKTLTSRKIFKNNRTRRIYTCAIIVRRRVQEIGGPEDKDSCDASSSHLYTKKNYYYHDYYYYLIGNNYYYHYYYDYYYFEDNKSAPDDGNNDDNKSNTEFKGDGAQGTTCPAPKSGHLVMKYKEQEILKSAPNGAQGKACPAPMIGHLVTTAKTTAQTLEQDRANNS